MCSIKWEKSKGPSQPNQSNIVFYLYDIRHMWYCWILHIYWYFLQLNADKFERIHYPLWIPFQLKGEQRIPRVGK